MEVVLTTLGYAVGLIGVVWVVTIWITSYAESRNRKKLEAEIRAIADDLSTDPKGLTLSEVVSLLEVAMIQELVVELRKMPPGSRSLQRAMEITGDENYGRTA